MPASLHGRAEQINVAAIREFELGPQLRRGEREIAHGDVRPGDAGKSGLTLPFAIAVTVSMANARPGKSSMRRAPTNRWLSGPIWTTPYRLSTSAKQPAFMMEAFGSYRYAIGSGNGASLSERSDEAPFGS